MCIYIWENSKLVSVLYPLGKQGEGSERETEKLLQLPLLNQRTCFCDGEKKTCL